MTFAIKSRVQEGSLPELWARACTRRAAWFSRRLVSLARWTTSRCLGTKVTQEKQGNDARSQARIRFRSGEGGGIFDIRRVRESVINVRLAYEFFFLLSTIFSFPLLYPSHATTLWPRGGEISRSCSVSDGEQPRVGRTWLSFPDDATTLALDAPLYCCCVVLNIFPYRRSSTVLPVELQYTRSRKSQVSCISDWTVLLLISRSLSSTTFVASGIRFSIKRCVCFFSCARTIVNSCLHAYTSVLDCKNQVFGVNEIMKGCFKFIEIFVRQ